MATNAEQVIKGLEKVLTGDIPFAVSRAMQQTIIPAVEAAETEFARYVRLQGRQTDPDDKISASLDKRGPGKGAIRGKWPTKKELQTGVGRRGRKVEAKVYIVNKPENGGSFDLIDELHPLVFGGLVLDVPETSSFVLTPTTALQKGLKGSGRFKKLNKFGNIARLKQGILTELKNRPDEYLNVPLNNTNPRTKHLKPGLYARGREISKGGLLKSGLRNDDTGRLSRSKNRGVVPTGVYRTAVSARGRSQRKQGRVVNYLVMLIAYHSRRRYEGNFRFPDVVLPVYEKTFVKRLSIEIPKAILT